jgi:hypothetical protein
MEIIEAAISDHNLRAPGDEAQAFGCKIAECTHRATGDEATVGLIP